MNWKLILSLSVFGVVMGLASVSGVTKGIEGWLWLVVWLICVVWIARAVATKRFQHGFMVGFIGGAVAPLIQGLLYSTYTKNNPEMTQQFDRVTQGLPARPFVMVSGLIIGLITGLVVGAVTWVAGKFIKPASVNNSSGQT
jgi:uncharacterized membrane protein YeaQ/YmgE (transglycosylase-associated protein family)